MELWIVSWKVLLIGGFSMCGLVTIWVTLAGWHDIKHLLNSLKERHDKESV